MEEIVSSSLKEGLSGRLLKGTGEERIRGISIDTRTLDEGDLFVAIEGEHYDAHSFLSQAFSAGAVGAIISKEMVGEIPPGTFLFQVEDTTKALGELAAWYRERFSIPVVAITGSAGKTTTKDMIAAILGERYICRKNTGNLNNEYGLPLTLLSLQKRDEVLITEMGMRDLHEIEHLARIAKPQIGVITNVGPTHLETLGSIENVARGKGELAQALPQEGHLILNGDDPRVRRMAEMSRAKVHFFGLEGRDLDVKALNRKNLGLKGMEFSLSGDDTLYHLPLPGEHNLYNALASIAVGRIFQVTPSEIQAGLKRFKPSPLRMEIKRLSGGITLINDTYNANPLSMEMLLTTLTETEASRRVAILGDMLELGEVSEREHRDLGKTVYTLGIDLLFTTGKEGWHIAEGAREAGMDRERVFYHSQKNHLLLSLKENLSRGDLVLLKASRGVALEELISAFKEE